VDSFVHLGQCNETFDELHHVDSIIEWAQDADMATGFVTTARIMHGTPAALYSHAADRRWECEATMSVEAKALGCKDIARQLIHNGPGRDINVIMGGGRQCLVSGAVGAASDPIDEWACQSQDGRNLLDDWKFDKRRRQLKHKLLNNNQDLLDLADADVDYVLG
jgi:alkaline phosphatase